MTERSDVKHGRPCCDWAIRLRAESGSGCGCWDIGPVGWVMGLSSVGGLWGWGGWVLWGGCRAVGRWGGDCRSALEVERRRNIEADQVDLATGSEEDPRDVHGPTITDAACA
ncbi:hypothetical protein GCM10009839_78030 [Catenulispora yoronensis]|uniref:Uncharacterized protein n=1 Tax=Catenulispora yoronensis TaxID=450799 RepID=A0ABP5GTU0_9ACTN